MRRRVGRRRDPLIRDDLAVTHAQHPLGVRCDIRFVGDHDDGAAVGVEVVEQRQHVGGAAAVERARRLIGQQQHRVGDDRPCDRHPLLLSARQLRGQVSPAVGEPDPSERGQRPPAPLGGRTPA